MAKNASVGEPQLSLAAVAASTPSADLTGYSDAGGLILVRLPANDGCAWFLGSVTGTISMGSTGDVTCDPSREPDNWSADGGDLPWRDDALHRADQVARDNATAVIEATKSIVFIKHLDPTVSGLQEKLRGLTFGSSSSVSTEVGLAADGRQVALAVLGQSGTCYLVRADFTDGSVLRYGTGAGSMCDAATAATAQDDAWPD